MVLLRVLLLLSGLFYTGQSAAEPRGELAGEGLLVVFERPLSDAAEDVLDIHPSVVAALEEMLGWPVEFRYTVLLLKDREEFQRAWGSEFVVAVARPWDYLIVLDYTRVAEKPFTLGSTLRHELCHLLLHHHIQPAPGELPRWFEEGVCQWVGGGMGELASIGRSSGLTVAALSGGLIPLESLRDFPKGGRPFILAYEESRSVIEYILTNHGREGLLNILDNLRDGLGLEEAVRLGLRLSLGELEMGWRADLKKRHNWLVWLSNNIHSVLFVLGALLLVWGFARTIWRIHTYRDEDEEDAGPH